MSDILRLNTRIKNKSAKLTDSDETASTSASYMSEEEIIQTNYQNYYDQGFADGQSAMRSEFEHEFHSMLTQKYTDIAILVKNFESALEEYQKSFDKLVLDTSLTIAQKIIYREIEAESPIHLNIRSALQKVMGANNITIKLSPSDFKIITLKEKELFGDSSLSHIKFESDDRIEAGGCFIETEIGNIDGRITAQIAELKRVLESSTNNS